MHQTYFNKTLRSSVSLILDDCTTKDDSINCRVVYDGNHKLFILRSIYENGLAVNSFEQIRNDRFTGYINCFDDVRCIVRIIKFDTDKQSSKNNTLPFSLGDFLLRIYIYIYIYLRRMRVAKI